MISARLTSLMTLLAAAACFVLAMMCDVYEARLYLAVLGILFMLCGMIVEVSALMLADDLDNEARRTERRTW